MSDRWARPDDGRQVIEIELVETGSAGGRGRRAADTGPDDAPHRPGRARWIVGAALVIGVGAGAMTLSGNDTTDDTDAAAASDTLFDASQITTPPTLPSLVTVPTVTEPEEATEGIDTDASDAILDEELLDPASVTVPEFPVVAELAPGTAPSGYELLPAAAANVVDERPMRSTVMLDGVQLDGRYRSAVTLVTIVDPIDERYTLTVDGVGSRGEFVVDVAGGTVYRTDSRLEGRWEQFDAARFTEGTGTDDLGELFDAFVTGPITPATLAVSTIETGDELVELDRGVVARPYTVITPITDLVPYGVLLLADIFDDSVADGGAPDMITFTVYVTEGSELALVTARFETRDSAFALEQTFGPPATDVSITLPSLDTLIPNAPQPSP